MKPYQVIFNKNERHKHKKTMNIDIEKINTFEK